MKNLALANLFYYQNPITQEPSSHAISVQQLCRVLCPASSSTSSTSSIVKGDKNQKSVKNDPSNILTTTRKTSSFWNENSMVLAYDPISQTFDEKGWKAIQDVAILKEASALWYFCHDGNISGCGSGGGDGNNNNSHNGIAVTALDTVPTTGGVTTSTDTSGSSSHHRAHSQCLIRGPLSCRELAMLYYEPKEEQRRVVTNETRVWSPAHFFQSGGGGGGGHRMDGGHDDSDNDKKKDGVVSSAGQWTRIVELPDLIMAMEAFEDCIHVDPPLNHHVDVDVDVDVMEKDGFKLHSRGPLHDIHDQEKKDTQDDDEDGESRKEKTSWSARLLDDFFSSTVTEKQNEGDEKDYYAGTHIDDDDDDDNDMEDDAEEYQSDGGTLYVKQGPKGSWVDSNSLDKINNGKVGIKRKRPQGQSSHRTTTTTTTSCAHISETDTLDSKTNKRSKKPKFKAKNAKCWVYVTNLPLDTNEKEVADFFKKAGVLDLDPETQKPRVKLYRKKDHDAGAGGVLKGDASVCYARPESVELALQILDDAPFRTVDAKGKYIGNECKIRVERAKFEQHGEEYKADAMRKISDKKRKVARLAKLQAVGWDDGENGRITGGLKGLRIIVLKNVFDAASLRQVGDEAKEDAFLKELEADLKKICDDYGTVEKITIFYKGRIDGVVIIKFTQPTAAGDAIEGLNGKQLRGKTMDVAYWDGVTDYTVHDHEQEAKEVETRLDEFGNWLESQELPDELCLQVEHS